MEVIVNVDKADLALADGHTSESLREVPFNPYLTTVLFSSRERHEAERQGVYVFGEVT